MTFEKSQEVYLLSGFGWERIEKATVARVMKTIVTIEGNDGRRFRTRDGGMIGITGTWAPKIVEQTPELHAQHALYQATLALRAQAAMIENALRTLSDRRNQITAEVIATVVQSLLAQHANTTARLERAYTRRKAIQ